MSFELKFFTGAEDTSADVVLKFQIIRPIGRPDKKSQKTEYVPGGTAGFRKSCRPNLKEF